MVLHDHATGVGPPVAILHGILGQARNWSPIARRLALRFRVHALDLRNHGSTPAATPMDYDAMSRDVVDTLVSAGLESAAVIGHSMGGKVAMVLALKQPDRVRRLVVVDIAPVSYAPDNLDLVRAMRTVDLTGVTRRSDVDRALASSVPDLRTRAFLLQGLVSGPDGGLRWRNDLELTERSMATLSGFPVLGPEDRYPGETLLVVGGRSDYVQPEHLPLFRARFPRLVVHTLAEAGHWVHADQPELFAALVADFLA